METRRKQEAEHGYHSFEVLCGTRSAHFVLWIDGRHCIEGKGNGTTASLHNSMPIFIQHVRSNHREQSGINPEGFAASSPLILILVHVAPRLHLGSVVQKLQQKWFKMDYSVIVLGVSP